MPSRLRLGQLLVDAKLITQEALDETLVAQRADGRRLGALLVAKGFVNEVQLTQILSHQLSVPWVSLLHIEFSRQLLNLVPAEVADRYCLVPIYVRHVRGQGETLYIAMDDPSNEEALRACGEHSGLPVRAMIAPPADIRSAIHSYYGLGPKPEAPPAPPAPEPEREPEPVLPLSGPRTDPAPPMPAERPRLADTLPSADVVAELSKEAPPAVSYDDAPVIEAVEVEVPLKRAPSDRLRALLESDPAPPSSRPVDVIPKPKGKARKMVSLTLLDGTTISLPAQRPKAAQKTADATPEPAPDTEVAPPPSVRKTFHSEPEGGLTAHDLVEALRAVSQGADASAVLGPDAHWERLFGALLSLLLRKHVIADWELVEELKKFDQSGQ